MEQNKLRPLFSKASLVNMSFKHTPNRKPFDLAAESDYMDAYVLHLKSDDQLSIHIQQEFKLYSNYLKKMDYVCCFVFLHVGYERIQIFPKDLFELRRLIASLNAVL